MNTTMKMWKLLVAAAVFISLGGAQRSSYAPRPGTNYKLLPRYRKNETDSGLGTRGGEEDSGATSSTLPPELQGTLEDHRFVQRVSGWPQDRQPFWFKNRYAISSMRDRDIDGGDVDRPIWENQRQRPQFQSSFQGPSSVRGRNGARGGPARVADEGHFYNDFDPLFFFLRKERDGGLYT